MNPTVQRVVAAGAAAMFILDGVAAMVALDLLTVPGIVRTGEALTTPPATAKGPAGVETELAPAASPERAR